MELVSLALAVLLLTLGALWFRKQRARVRERLAQLQASVGGELSEGPWFAYPRLCVDLHGARVQVSCLAGSKHRPAQTFAWLGCDQYPALSFTLRRARAGLLESIGWKPIVTGERAFDSAFQLDKRAPERIAELFDGDLRAALRAVDEKLSVNVALGRSTTYRDGRLRFGRNQQRLEVSLQRLPPEPEDLLALLAIASCLHARLLRTELAISA